MSDALKAALLISSTDRCRYGKLKDKLMNNHLFREMDQYPDMFEKALHILGNYQTTRNQVPFRPNSNDTGVAFL